jgi:ATP-dependent Clp protease ATP-binding subunit ClpC
MVAMTPSRVPPAPDLARALEEARQIADGVGQPLSTTHLLFALFTVPNPAEVLLKERMVDEDKLLAHVSPASSDAGATFRAVLDSADETALRCDARQTNTLHLLVAILKARDCAAYVLLESCLGNVAPFRNLVMSFVTGVLPRRLQQPILDAKNVEPPAPPAPLPRAPRPPRPAAQKKSDDWVVPKSTWIDPGAAPEGDRKSRISVVDEPEAQAAEKEPEPAPPPRRRDSKPKTILPTMPPTRFDLPPDRFPWLCALGRNLTALASNGMIDPSIGRAAELEQLIDVLGKRRANNPCLVGDPGVGKTAIVEGLAVKLVRGDPDVAPLEGKVVVELDMGRITAGTALRGSFSERMQGLKKDVARSKGQVIVFIDELHTLMGAGSTGEGPQDAANELKAALARGDFPCIGSTTIDEYKKYVEQDPALDRRFVKILVEEPDDEQTVAILRGAAPLYEAHHKVRVTDDALQACVQLSSRFLHDRRQPAKSIDLLDLSLSRARRSGVKRIGRPEVAKVCADVAKVPLERALLEDGTRFLEMEKFVREKVVGHEQVVARVAETVRRNYAGFTTQRPMGSFLFLGPSGVGKTELAKALADFLYGSTHALVRVDMSEYSEPHTVARLVGAPPGYVGHQDGGQLTEAIRRRPHAVVLLDEIEKAHADVLPLLLQILDEGRLTDGRGRTVTFRHAVVVMTSNLGAAAAVGKARAVGFGAADAPAKSVEDAVLEGARKHFAPELWGRIEDKLVFQALTRPQVLRIAAILLAQSSKALETSRSIRFSTDESVLALLADQGGFDAASGARPMRQAIQRLVESPLSDAILKGTVKAGDAVRLAAEGGRVVVRRA